MSSNATRTEEDDRIAELYRYQILDTVEEERFDRVTRLVADIFGVPMAAISLVDVDRQWFKSRIGLGTSETPRSVAFCDKTIKGQDPLVVCDATADPDFASNPLVTDDPNIRFYAGAPLITPSGQKLGALCAIDRRARSASPEQLSALQSLAAVVVDELELRVAHAKEAGFRQAAERASDAKSQFLSRMSHEIRTPLSTIIGYSDLILLQSDVPNNDHVDKIRSSAMDLLFLLDNMLDLTKIDYGKLNLECEPLNLHDTLRDLFEQFTKTAKAANQAFSFSLQTDDDRISPVMGDERRTRQIISNIIDNALKFAPDAPIRVEAQIMSCLDGKTTLKCAIEDQGPGIPMEMASQIFEVFQQIDESTQREREGPGLGLPIAQSLARMMDGEIKLTSQYGKGSRFDVTLVFDQDPSIARNNDNEQTASSLPLQGRRLLLVEDNETNARMIAAILSTWGCEVIVAEDGLVALDKLQNMTPDVVLLDLHMPKLDGWKTLERIRAQHSPDLRVLALTADAFEETHRKCLEAGFDGFVSKPIEWGILYAEIGEAVGAAA